MLPIMAAGSEFCNLCEIKSRRDKLVELVSSKSDSLVKFLYASSLRDKLFTSEFIFLAINLKLISSSSSSTLSNLNICEAFSFNIIMLARPGDGRTTTLFLIYSVTLFCYLSLVRFKSFPPLSKYKLCSSVDVQILSFRNLIIFAKDATVTSSLGIFSFGFWAALTFLGFMNNFLQLPWYLASAAWRSPAVPCNLIRTCSACSSCRSSQTLN